MTKYSAIKSTISIDKQSLKFRGWKVIHGDTVVIPRNTVTFISLFFCGLIPRSMLYNLASVFMQGEV